MVPRWRIAGAVALRDALELGRSASHRDPMLTRDDVAFLQYTGGTTGVAKGVVLSHRNMIANVLQLGAWVAPVLREGVEMAVIPLPLYPGVCVDRLARVLARPEWRGRPQLMAADDERPRRLRTT